jgi:hypothetical protein
VAIALVIGAIFTPAPVLIIGLVLVGVVAMKVALQVRDAARTEAPAPVESMARCSISMQSKHPRLS